MKPKRPQGPKTGPKHELLENRSESACSAHTLHTCPNHRRFSKTILEKTFLSRDRVRNITFSVHVCPFRCGFITGFESITKPQRETQKQLFECRMCGYSRRLLQISKGAHKIYYEPADFWTRGRQGPIQSRKQVVWSTHASPTAARAFILHKSAPNANRVGGHAINRGKRNV